jgi:hypothetical protein
MKKITFLVFSFLLAVGVMAQPQYYNANSGGIGNSLPFGSLAINGYKTQWLIGPGEYIQPSPAPAGNITKLYIWMSTSGSGTYTQLTIKMGQTALTTFPTGTIYAGQLDTVYYNIAGALSSTTNTWMSITLTRPFLYNPAQSLVIEVSHCGFSGSGMNVWQTQGTTGIIRRNNIPGTTACVFTYSSQDTRILQNGIDIAPVIPNGWVGQNPSGVTTSLNTVSTVNANVGWIGGNGGVVLRTINAGTNWTNVTGSPIGSADVYAICGIDANTCLVSTSPNATFVYRTSNGGVNWTQVFTQAAGFIDDIKFQNATTGFMYGDPVGARWSLWKSTNGGVNWDSAGLYLPQAGSEAGWNNAMWLVGNNLWFGTNNTRVYYSTNFGTSWLFGATTGTVNGYSVTFNTGGGIGFAGQTVAVKSTNGGANWSTFTLPGSGTCYSFNNVLDRFWYCRGTGVYWSSNNGANFASQFADTGTYIAMNLKLDGQIIRGWAVTSNGRIARYHELISGISNNQNNMPENYSLLQNYPNPFNPSTKISFSLPKAGDVKLVVFDILGREIATLVNGFTGAGNHTVDFNAANLSSGVYLYKIQAGDFTETRKMILMK